MNECVFCKIVGNIAGERIVHRDETFVAFYDIKPQAELHLLVIPNTHLVSIDHLSFNEIHLIEKMKELGNELLQNLVGEKEKRFGFHVPPFTSVDHLHLHCFGGEMSFAGKFSYANWSFWFKTPEEVILDLKKKN
eukprot:TRINITY_DN11257_c0_g1_i1.p1 TRINITY_DN11257_c0_g1~~TRINITY_DN11257_c0_g1_i1.p1  ORF type:complete len:135 (+),score=28.40 TRINITY_DN11257_c0_g1_i1:167-571(+)